MKSILSSFFIWIKSLLLCLPVFQPADYLPSILSKLSKKNIFVFYAVLVFNMKIILIPFLSLFQIPDHFCIDLKVPKAFLHPECNKKWKIGSLLFSAWNLSVNVIYEQFY